MQHATQCLSVVHNVLNLHSLLLYDTSIESLYIVVSDCHVWSCIVVFFKSVNS